MKTQEIKSWTKVVHATGTPASLKQQNWQQVIWHKRDN
jgi:hypothetical protein